MILNRVIIKNFRSISDCTLTIDKTFQILVGINEAGKSNLLKALSLISEEVEISKNDIRDPTLEDENIEESYIRFIFTLEAEDQKKIYNEIKDKILSKNAADNILTIGDTETNIKDFIKYKSECLYNVDLISGKRVGSHFKMEGPKYRIKNNWKKIIDSKNLTIANDNMVKPLKDYVLININDYPQIENNLVYEDLDITKLNLFVGNYFVDLLTKNIPNCVLWSYKEANLLPGKIDLNSFKQNPKICLPLKIMFNLSGYEDIKKSLTDAEAKINGMRNILKKVSERTTSHMKKVWPEWNKLTVSITQNGSYLEAGIQDEVNFYSLERRSDGFKRFFTFLLMVSAQNKTMDLKGNIILIDEPEIGIHPSGQQFLLSELIKIGIQNIVIVSTHSIFMIDKEKVDRHIIVKKREEVTTLEEVGYSNILDEEVVFKALGYSVYELLKPKNIIFEGWRDKKIFEIFIKSKRGNKLIGKKEMVNVGLLHAAGVKDVERIANLCENLGREYIIVTDCDNPALEKQKAFSTREKWITYKDISNVKAITTEDFVNKKVINKAIRKVLQDFKVEGDVEVGQSEDSKYISTIEGMLKKIFSSQVEPKKILNNIKDAICENTKSDDMDSSYENVVKIIADRLINIHS